MAKTFRDLQVWQKAIELTMLTYRLTASFPKSEAYALTAQMQRAAVSIASNIAEGSARGSKKDFRNFVYIAKGSTCELQTQLVIAARLGYGSPEMIKDAELVAQEIGRMLSGLAKYLSEQIRARRNEHSL